eukprot:m.18014 g.18014  ORF g.18014 m.18014 type:complete len:279 (+) comp6166_c0_seq1:88-924(+)
MAQVVSNLGEAENNSAMEDDSDLDAEDREILRQAQEIEKKQNAKRSKPSPAIDVWDGSHGAVAHIKAVEDASIIDRQTGLIRAKAYHCSANADLMNEPIGRSFERHEWYFDENGCIHVLYEACIHKEKLTQRNRLQIPSCENGGPTRSMITSKVTAAQHFARLANSDWTVSLQHSHAFSSAPKTIQPTTRAMAGAPKQTNKRKLDEPSPSSSKKKKSKSKAKTTTKEKRQCRVCKVAIGLGELDVEKHMTGKKHTKKAKEVGMLGANYEEMLEVICVS